MIPLRLYALAGVILVLLLAISATYVQTKRLATEKAAFSAYRTQVEALGREAEKAAKTAEIANQKAKEKADRENKDTRAALDIALNSLRDSRPASDLLPAPAPGSSRPDLACYDRAELARAYGSLVDGIRAIADECAAATIDLNTAKQWAQP